MFSPHPICIPSASSAFPRLQDQAPAMRVTSSLSPVTHPGPRSLLFSHSQKGPLNPKQILCVYCSNPAVAPISLRKSPRLLVTCKGPRRHPTPHFSPDLSIPLLQTHRSPCCLKNVPSTILPQGVCTCCSSSCLRDHVLDICRALNSKNLQKLGKECLLEMSGHQP